MISDINRKIFDNAVNAILADENMVILNSMTVMDYFYSLVYHNVTDNKVYMMSVDKEGVYVKQLND